MKSIKTVLTVIMVAFCTLIANAKDGNPIDDKEGMVVSNTVQKLLKEPSFVLERDFSITVKLVVDDKNEINVLSVATDFNKEIVEKYIRRRLDHKKLNASIGSRTYVVPVKMVKQ